MGLTTSEPTNYTIPKLRRIIREKDPDTYAVQFILFPHQTTNVNGLITVKPQYMVLLVDHNINHAKHVYSGDFTRIKEQNFKKYFKHKNITISFRLTETQQRVADHKKLEDPILVFRI